MYCCSIDLKTWSDSIYKNGLRVKLPKTGIDEKLLNVVRPNDNEVKLCVRYVNTWLLLLWSWIIEGRNSVFVSDFDIEMFLQDNSNSGITLDQLFIFLLLFADDAVIFSEAKDGLQSQFWTILYKMEIDG